MGYSVVIDTSRRSAGISISSCANTHEMGVKINIKYTIRFMAAND